MAGSVQLPKTGQTTCHNSTGSSIPCSGTGQDGELQVGVAWPQPRFADNGDSTVTDRVTGMIWTKDGNVMKTRNPGFDNDTAAGDGAVTWLHALDYIKKLNQENYLGHRDWRLPNIRELESLVNAGQSSIADWLTAQGYSNVQADPYWSSSTCDRSVWSSSAGAWVQTTDSAWVVDMELGGAVYGSGKTGSYHVCRGRAMRQQQMPMATSRCIIFLTATTPSSSPVRIWTPIPKVFRLQERACKSQYHRSLFIPQLRAS